MIYEELLKEMELRQKESLYDSHRCSKEEEEFETTKPQRNIFKMSRVLVDKKDKKVKNKGTSKSAQEKIKHLKKMKETGEIDSEELLVCKDKIEDEIENAEKEYDYDESSDQGGDSDVEKAREKIKKPQQEF
jgi:hypothetical protein